MGCLLESYVHDGASFYTSCLPDETKKERHVQTLQVQSEESTGLHTGNFHQQVNASCLTSLACSDLIEVLKCGKLC